MAPMVMWQELRSSASPLPQANANNMGGANTSVLFASLKLCGCNSVVECQLPKLNVAGSSPVTRLQKIN